MKQLVFMFSVLWTLFSTNQAYAQRCLPDMQGIRITGGMVDGMHRPDSRNKLGYSFGLSMSTYSKGGHQWVFGAEYLNKYYPYRANRIPVSQFTGEGGYFLNFLSTPGKTLLFSLGASALAGYETSNWGEKTLFDGATLRNKDGFVYGGALTLEMETYLSDRIVLLLTARERVLWGTSTGRFHAQFGAGLKWMIH